MADFMEYEHYDALGLAELVKRGDITLDEMLDAAIERVERHNPAVNAVVMMLYDQARAAIRAGLPDGPFKGVPFLLKDLSACMAGVPTTGGCRFFLDFVPDHDTTLVERYRRAGLVIFGKTNTPELGLTVSTEPALYGPARNPWNLERSTGGSSGGAGAAVASGMVPLADASDGGGSIRIPASCCGLFGLKPTRARNPAGPDMGEGWSGLAAAHPITRSVRDSAAILDAVSGFELGAPYSVPTPERPFLEEVGADPGRLRIAMTLTAPSGVPVGAEVRAAVERAAKLCQDLGHEVEEAWPTLDAEALQFALTTIIAAHTAATLDLRAQQLGRAYRVGDVEPITFRLAENGRKLDSMAYARALRIIHKAGRQVAYFQRNYDVMLCPTLAQPPVPLGILTLSNDDVRQYITTLLAFSPFTSLANMTGQPSISVPLAWSSDGLPIGVLFTGRYAAEATLFRLAAQLEQAQPWFDRRPEMAVKAA